MQDLGITRIFGANHSHQRDFVASRNRAVNLHIAQPGMKRGPYGSARGKCRAIGLSAAKAALALP